MALIQEHCSFLQISNSHLPNPHKLHFPLSKIPPFPQIPATRLPNPRKLAKFLRIPTTGVSNSRKKGAKIANSSEILATHVSNLQKVAILMRNEASWCKFLIPMAVASSPLPSSAAEAAEADGKISIEAIVVAIDDFFNRNPFFVAGVVFIWLVVIPLTQEYLKKYKPVTAIDAFRNLRDVPEAQLLDIRRKKSVQFMASPNLKLLGKNVVQVEFDEDDEEGFVREVLGRFRDPANAVVCVLDNFDGNSLKVAELLFNNGFKEAYAIKGGLRGTDGWQAIQEKYLPPSVHVFPRKKKSKKLAHLDVSSDGTDEQSKDEGKALTSPSSALVNTANEEDGHENLNDTTSAVKHATGRPLSPYPNYHDLKPPSSPSPSKPDR